ncbi:aldehyde dehydrogenase family protein [Yinghuangia sp. ASG 101]|uniref:aldehyde dehydrogenase family protein n=1 Tax=Yinghuangia sp. ASG 101 TaxID=2896848 RepID=UPI001E3801D1|nr:aldehyde dehydrogenase family protein [Yinghuangia sp. ASG 101]UGQ13626.1 aldehyde dehydrogenase family protein [Yinghuangia sp. ASG 101]
MTQASSPATMTIGGTAHSATATIDVVNPATGTVFAQAPDCSPAQLDAAFASAATAFGTWRRDEDTRRDLLRACAKALTARTDDIAVLLTTEQGKPLAEAAGEVRSVAAWLTYYADLEIPREITRDDKRGFAEVVRRPIGPVAAITPWNFPLTLAFWKLAPALRAGNTVVLKPSPYTPLSTLLVGEILRDVLPPGVVNTVSGGDRLGALMTAHPLARKISFTGSVETGRRVAAAAAPDLKRVTLELGGNDAAIVLDDADVPAIADKLFWGAFANNGQVCSAVKRVYVPRALHDDLVEALAVRARGVRVGDGATEGVRLGPVNNRPQFDRVSGLVADALARGATAAAGGHPLELSGGQGYFYAPTILTGAEDGTPIVDEEQFGPALPVVPYTELDDAVDRVNAGHFGLGGSVWSADPDRAADVAARLDVGTAWINTHLALAPAQPFGGAKWSGLGVENGPWGLYGFTELQVIHRAR